MGHNHSHSRNSTRNIKVAFFLNISFTVFEIIGGIWTNSVAILSDAIHDLGDSFSLGLSWYLDKKSKQGANKRFSFGYKRFSLLGAIINCVVLLLSSIFLLTEIVPRLVEPENVNVKGMFIFAIFGIIVNGAAVMQVKGGKTMNERVVSLHLLEDVLGWVAVLIVSIVLMFWDIPILDPILSLIILSYVLYNVIKNLKETLVLFLQGVPVDVNLKELEQRIESIENVVSMHQLKVWSLDGEEHILTIHVVVEDNTSLQELVGLKKSIKLLLKELQVKQATIEFEFQYEECL